MKKIILLTLAGLNLFYITSLHAYLDEGKKVYQQSCAGCHETGTANAPLRSDTKHWQKRMQEAHNQSVLANSVIQGMGAMPPKGGCANCTEDEIRTSVAYMLSGLTNPTPAKKQLPLETLTLPPGFSIEIFAENLPGSRTLAMSDSGVIFVGTRNHGNVYALIPGEKPGEAKRQITLLSGLNEPNSIAIHDGDLYVAEIHQVTKYPDVDQHLDKMPKPIIINDDLPKARWHGYRVMHVGPDNHLYIAIGMPCNTCNYRPTQPLYGTISRMTLDGKNLAPYAIGIRNSVGFDFHPATKQLWFTDNGQDLMGDDLPPDKINVAPKPGLDFGFPFVYGQNILAPGYIESMIKDKTFEKPAYELQAHVAPLGMVFYTGKQFPKNYHNQMFVALHGSWNRSKKVGYEVIALTLEGNRITSMKPFVSGFLEGQEGWGRPVDFLTLPDGSLLITDDLNGLIYRVTYSAPESTSKSSTNRNS